MKPNLAWRCFQVTLEPLPQLEGSSPPWFVDQVSHFSSASTSFERKPLESDDG